MYMLQYMLPFHASGKCAVLYTGDPKVTELDISRNTGGLLCIYKLLFPNFLFYHNQMGTNPNPNPTKPQ